jgi:hypothetical protein
MHHLSTALTLKCAGAANPGGLTMRLLMNSTALLGMGIAGAPGLRGPQPPAQQQAYEWRQAGSVLTPNLQGMGFAWQRHLATWLQPYLFSHLQNSMHMCRNQGNIMLLPCYMHEDGHGRSARPAGAPAICTGASQKDGCVLLPIDWNSRLKNRKGMAGAPGLRGRQPPASRQQAARIA